MKSTRAEKKRNDEVLRQNIIFRLMSVVNSGDAEKSAQERLASGVKGQY